MNDRRSDRDRLDAILDYWIEHNEEHKKENERWLEKAREYGNSGVVDELKKVIAIYTQADQHIKAAKRKLHETMSGKPSGGLQHERGKKKQPNHSEEILHRHIEFHQIGTIRTPYPVGTPFIDMRGSAIDCKIVVDKRFGEGLQKLDTFTYIIVLYYLDRLSREPAMTVYPSWAGGVQTGLFASRSPSRPNPIGLSTVRIKGISGNIIHTEGIDAYDGTPLLDIKPYIGNIDAKRDAGNGWIDELEDSEKILASLSGYEK